MLGIYFSILPGESDELNPYFSLQVSLAGRQLIYAMLQRDPASRLGSNNGANEIKQHPFFRGINWPLIRCMVLFFRQ